MGDPTPDHSGATGPRIVVLSGNPRQSSRTCEAARALAASLASALEQPGAAITVVDLAEFGGAVIDGSTAVDQAMDMVRSADVLIVATPVYKASYTGLLKAFLDRFGGGELADVLAVPFTLAAAPIHRLAADVHLRPLLVELGASTPTRAFAIEEDAIPSLPDTVGRWIQTEAATVKELLSSRLAVPADR
jgi:FMN reductase